MSPKIEPASIALAGLTAALGGRAAVSRLALGALLWLVATALLSFPTVLYVPSLYLPSDNALNIGERAGEGCGAACRSCWRSSTLCCCLR